MVEERGLGAERVGCHELEAESENAVYIARADERRSAYERSTSRRAIVVHVLNWDAYQAKLVEGCLARGDSPKT